MPQRLYKYESFNIRSLENLKAQAIYFGTPSAFNDPYDCAFTPGIKELSDEDVEEVRAAYLVDPTVPDAMRQHFANAPVQILRTNFVSAGRKALDEAIKKFINTRGVSCFSEKNDDLLMWSHYGGSHKGFCLEFDTAFEPFTKIRKVRYSSEMPQIDLMPLLISDDHDQVLDLFATKAKAWEYECEWRALHANAGTSYTYPAQSLTGVFFGPQMSAEAIEIVCLVLQGQSETVQFWRGKRSTAAFKVNFENFTYTSHLKAKRDGLI
jgi:hypothetical protein